MSGLKLFVVATLAAVLTFAGANTSSANGNRIGTIKLTGGEPATVVQKVHHSRKYRRYYKKRRYYKRRYYKRRYYKRRYYGYGSFRPYRYRYGYGYYRPYRYRYGYYRSYRRYYRSYGPSIYFRTPGFGFYFGY